ncbi:hypothetical protein CDAR_268621 [Caerostris darwini]|uniref:Uncharacterized protein n=1 Tax=Caerostris darwini TaxID=1538125 RepID=A0AAV4X1Q8_9ARAC|nr:hypothetical protein CDAR_268621 [Caerostris darwini]
MGPKCVGRLKVGDGRVAVTKRCCSFIQDLFGEHQQVGQTCPSGHMGRIHRHCHTQQKRKIPFCTTLSVFPRFQMEGLLGPAIKKRDGIDRGRRKIAPDNPEKFSYKGTELTKKILSWEKRGPRTSVCEGFEAKICGYEILDTAKIFQNAI